MNPKIKEINKKNNIEYTMETLNRNIELLNMIAAELVEIIIDHKMNEMNNSMITIISVNEARRDNDNIKKILNVSENINRLNTNKINISYKLSDVVCVNDFTIFDNNEHVKKIKVLMDVTVSNKDDHEAFKKKIMELYSLVGTYILVLSNLKKNLLILVENLSLY